MASRASQPWPGPSPVGKGGREAGHARAARFRDVDAPEPVHRDGARGGEIHRDLAEARASLVRVRIRAGRAGEGREAVDRIGEPQDQLPVRRAEALRAHLGREERAVRREGAAERLGLRHEVARRELADLQAGGVEHAPAGRWRRLPGVLAEHEPAAAARQRADHAVHVAARAEDGAGLRVGGRLDEHVLGERARVDRVHVDAAQPVAFGRVEQLTRSAGAGEARHPHGQREPGDPAEARLMHRPKEWAETTRRVSGSGRRGSPSPAAPSRRPPSASRLLEQVLDAVAEERAARELAQVRREHEQVDVRSRARARGSPRTPRRRCGSRARRARRARARAPCASSTTCSADVGARMRRRRRTPNDWPSEGVVTTCASSTRASSRFATP